MIIAEINNQKMVLGAMEDATLLMAILERATPVSPRYSRGYSETYYIRTTGELPIKISFATGEIEEGERKETTAATEPVAAA